MWALLLVATFAAAFRPHTGVRRTTQLRAAVANLASGRQRFCVGLVALDPPAPGTEFMHPLLISGAAKELREGGAAAIVVEDATACDAVAGDRDDNYSDLVVLYAGERDAPASADAKLVACEASDVAGGKDVVPVVSGLETASAVVAAAQSAADQGSECLIMRGGDVEALGPIDATAIPVLRELAFAFNVDIEALDTEAFACKTLGYAGVIISPVGYMRPVGILSAALASALKVLRSKRSRNYGGAWSGYKGQTSETADQTKAMKWARYMETTSKAGIVGAMEKGEGDTGALNTERGDYKAFDGPAAAGSTERPASAEPDFTQAEKRTSALKNLKDRGWNT